MPNKKMEEKKYIITYESREHYEVLGWVKALSLEEAKKKAQQELLKEAKYYDVAEAEIAEWKDDDTVHFDLS